MALSKQKTFSLTYQVASLHGTRKDLIAFLMDAALPVDVVSQIELAAYEALVNIIEHNPHPRAGAKISMRCTIAPARITLTIANTGVHFDPTAAPMPDLAEHFKKGRRRGLGIYIIRTLMDTMEYSFAKGVNRLRMVKRIA